ncbi:hypothetical protein Kfla_6023 [Kribbella flavida DSM 17836]|uniref:Uncharacterized protein n=1 Tax=Kribbella flavida (strain DSM 17836 / JCM 10339 / NBRC 14399) TaxID=479435 RepID=D2PSX4_KRIFD|nr:hypothetical protein [Kribbella flavida]ADB35026.1 hypothetical protein Kfla_6023 [Kribbella flavida DSM 17836]
MGLFSRRTEADNVALAAARARLSSEDVDQVRFLLTTRKTVFAVKYVMDRTGAEIKPAKELVEDIRLGRYVPPVTETPVVRRPGTNLAERTRALKAAGELHQATALVVSETGMTEAEAGLFVGALKPDPQD